MSSPRAHSTMSPARANVSGVLDLKTSAITTVPHDINAVYFKQSSILY